MATQAPFTCGGRGHRVELRYVRRPFLREPDFSVKVNYELAELLRSSSGPQWTIREKRKAATGSFSPETHGGFWTVTIL